jgi:hypothetical protein
MLRRLAVQRLDRRAVPTNKENRGDREIIDPAEAERMLAKAAAKIAAAEQHEAKAAQLRKDAEAFKKAARLLKQRAATGLPLSSTVRTLTRMELHTVPEDPWRPGAPLTSGHPFPAALEKAKMTVGEWAKRHSVSEEKVRSWYRVNQLRRIPRKFARDIEKEFGLPADATIWPKGIKG